MHYVIWGLSVKISLNQKAQSAASLPAFRLCFHKFLLSYALYPRRIVLNLGCTLKPLEEILNAQCPGHAAVHLNLEEWKEERRWSFWCDFFN